MRLAASLLDRWVRLHQKIDFEKIKSDLIGSEETRAFFKKNGHDGTDTEKIITAFVEVLEYVFLVAPLRRTLFQLCEQARQGVLATSIQNVRFEDKLERLIQAIWLIDIDVKSGRG
ncbi:hypothetical protein [Methylosinus sporium]|uniref:hypothetical protein n=1 Tax=Methylosinus sporium TaxID=428 RepID=UPI003DA6EB0C